MYGIGHQLIVGVALTMLVVCLVFLLRPTTEDGVRQVDARAGALVVALRQYVTVFGSPPIGDSEAISTALTGRNPKGVVFIDGYGWTNGTGQLLDPWGRPYAFGFPLNCISVASAGPDGIPGDKDDVTRLKPQQQTR
jgi:hypothetical protein